MHPYGSPCGLCLGQQQQQHVAVAAVVDSSGLDAVLADAGHVAVGLAAAADWAAAADFAGSVAAVDVVVVAFVSAAAAVVPPPPQQQGQVREAPESERSSAVVELVGLA